MEGNNPAVSVSMTCNSLYCKILYDLTDEDFEKWLPGFDGTEDITVTG